jgi:hypothetical protein
VQLAHRVIFSGKMSISLSERIIVSLDRAQEKHDM